MFQRPLQGSNSRDGATASPDSGSQHGVCKEKPVQHLKEIRSERDRFQNKLAKIKGIRVIPSQANFIMVELDKSISSKDLLKKMLVKHSILIKELTTKTNGGNYLRLAVRDKTDNNTLISAMKAELEQ